MFLRIKKRVISDGNHQYIFFIVENHREGKKVKQKVLRYLFSYNDSPWGYPEDLQKVIAWLRIYSAIKDLKPNDVERKNIVGKVEERVSMPNKEDFTNHVRVLNEYHNKYLIPGTYDEQVMAIQSLKV